MFYDLKLGKRGKIGAALFMAWLWLMILWAAHLGGATDAKTTTEKDKGKTKAQINNKAPKYQQAIQTGGRQIGSRGREYDSGTTGSEEGNGPDKAGLGSGKGGIKSGLGKPAPDNFKPPDSNSGRLRSGPASRGRYRSNCLDNLGTFKITGYCPCEKCTGKRPSDPRYKVTTSGVKAREGVTVAADWRLLPPGTVIRIEGLPGTYTVQDKGGAITGRRIDLYFNNHDDALAWGRQDHQVWVIRRAANEA